jgi:hypothetical protein
MPLFLGVRRVDDFDRELHSERRNPPLPWERSAAKRTGEGTGSVVLKLDPLILPSLCDGPLLLPEGEGDLPDGAMIEIDGDAYAVKGPLLLRWSHGGYVDALPRNSSMHGRLLTPPSILRILGRGYTPRWGDWG